MDATANDVSPTYDVKGFPNIFWLPKDSKDAPIRYEGGRDVDEISSLNPLKRCFVKNEKNV
jgi:protein disulfide-isomerase A3